MSESNTPEKRLTPAQALKASEERVTALEAEKTTLQADLSAAETLAEETQTALTDLQSKFDTLQTEATAATEKVVALEADLVTAKEVTAKAVSDKAGEIVANLGVAPVNGDKPSDGGAKEKTLIEQYEALKTPRERDNFRKQHAAELQKELQSKSNR